ncbi:MAG: tripartite tricarboxylate transporter TctB family protein, partial [Pyramidobacter sp.]
VPKILGTCFVILGIILTGGSLLSHNTEKRKETPKKDFTFIVLLSIICFIYLNLLPYLGYLLATPLLIAGILIVTGGVPLKTILSVSIGGMFILFTVFYSLLKVNLPLGFMKEIVMLLPLRF